MPFPQRSWARHKSVLGTKTSDRKSSEILAAGSLGKRSKEEREGSRDWNSLEFQDTANSGQKKETKAMVFYQMDTEEISNRFVAPCFINGLEAYDGEINLGVEKNMISNKYAFIINPEEDDVEPGVIFGRSFLRMTKAITDFGVGTITIYPEIYPFLEDIEEEEKSLDDWDHLLDFNIDDIPLLGEEGLPPFVCKMGKSSRNKKRVIENLNFFYQDIGTSSSAVWKDKVELDGKIVKEEEEVVNRIKGEALKEKDDPGAFIFPIRLERQEKRIEKVVRGINNVNHTQAEAMGILTNVLCQVGVTTLISKFLILYIPIDRDSPIVVGRGFLRMIGAIVNTPKRLFSTFDGFCHQTFRAARSDVMRNSKSDSDDEEEYQIKRNKFGAPIYGLKPPPYLNFSFLGSVLVPLKHVNWKPDYKGCYTKEEEATRQWRTEIRVKSQDQVGINEGTYTMGTHNGEAGSSRSKRSRQHETVEEVLLQNVHHEFLLWEGCSRDAKSRYNTKLAQLLPRHIYSPCVVNWDVLNQMGHDGEIDDMLRIRLRKIGTNKEIFTFVAWVRAFNMLIYAELCHEFYSTYEFDEVCADDELQTKNIIKFRLGGRAHSLTLLEFAQRLGLYQAVELDEEGFNVYFEGGLRSDDHFKAQDYWTTGYDKVQKNDLWLLSMFDARHQNGYANVAWLIARWMKKKGAGTQTESQIFYLDTITLIDLIDSEGKLIPEDPQPGVPRVGIPRPPRASMQDLYDRMGKMEIRQEAIERMEYRQSYHWDRYQGVFEHMARVYSVQLQGAYNPPGYVQPYYDQYYQQYPPPPL
ncbi:hypothetical protein Tco_1132371 [Tanacetum coccineum]|uniref:Uncharacterized protein n=1 Tax=Tanacetum coccineum TaxID=301880 RepID=A0ABQ5JBP8_9ASTR